MDVKHHMEYPKSFQKELEVLLNKHKMESGSNTPDFILAEYLCGCLASYSVAVNSRERWYGRETSDGSLKVKA